MANHLPSEAGVEGSILRWLDGLGWETHGIDGGEGAHVLDDAYDRSTNEVVYWDLLGEQVAAINDDITENNVDRFLTSLRRDLDHDNLMDGNRAFHRLLRAGKKFNAKHSNGTTKPTYIQLIDFENPENNRFHAANQFRVSRAHSIRPDVSLFVNGIPIVTMELKSLAQNSDYYDAISDLHGYEADVPRLFVPGLFNIAADTTELRYGAVGAPTAFYNPWKDAPPEYDDESPMKRAIQATCNPETLLDLLDNYVFYERRPGQDAKIIPRSMQYYAVRGILNRVAEGKADCGLIWHTQGSGKSYTMLYAARNLLTRGFLNNPQVFIIVDTDKLSGQMGDVLSNIGFEQSVVAQSRPHLQELIEDGASQLVLTTIQKFQDVDPDTQGNPETVVMSDEAHRFMEKDLGNRLAAALPDAYHFGFTGTPVREGERDADRNTFTAFSPEGEDYLHRYSIKRGIEDGLILPVYFTLRHQMDWDIDEDAMDIDFEGNFSNLSIKEKREVIQQYVTSTEIAELRPRVSRVAEEIDHHFEHVGTNGWKGMVVTPSRRAAALYGEQLLRYRDREEIEVIYTATDDDDEFLRQFATTSEERDSIVKRYKKDQNPKLLVVCDMLLTGFDAPILKTMYLDRNLKDHNLMQAIARTNRPAEGKENGEIVDFQGVFRNIDDALDYDDETKQFAARDRDELLEDLETVLEDLLDIFEGIPKTDSQETVERCLTRVSKHPAKREFKQGYRQLQDLYESLSPDPALVNSGAQEKYQWLTRIYVAFRRNNNREENPEDDFREKTREIIAEHVDVTDIKDQFPVYKISEEHLEAVQAIDEPAAQATSIAHATQDHLQPRVGQNPRYKRLSERVNEVVNTWQGGGMDDIEAVETLEALEREAIEVRGGADDRGMADAEYAIYAELVDERDDVIESDAEAEAIAHDITESFAEEIDTEFEGWKTNENTLDAIEMMIIDVLVKDHDKAALVKADGFLEDARRYLVENYE